MKNADVKSHAETVAVHAGLEPDPSTGAVAPGIALSTVFTPDSGGDYKYTRVDNPNRRALERCLAELEGGAVAACFSSGVAAASAVLHTLAPGDHVLVANDVYYGNRLLLTKELAHWGLNVEFVDMTQLDGVASAWNEHTELVWVETPSNPLLRISDIAALAELAHARGALCAVDNTFATPILQNPLSLGADWVLHSASKYFSGHSDILGGAVIAAHDNEAFQRLRSHQITVGSVPSPFDCWLLRRSIATLPLRIRAQSDNALAVAKFLSEHPEAPHVFYPGLPGHPDHDLAMKQMSMGGAVVSFRPHGGKAVADKIVGATQLFTRATSLGGVESLIERRAASEGPGSMTPDDLIRLSIGLEYAQDLIDDLSQAISAAQ